MVRNNDEFCSKLFNLCDRSDNLLQHFLLGHEWLNIFWFYLFLWTRNVYVLSITVSKRIGLSYIFRLIILLFAWLSAERGDELKLKSLRVPGETENAFPRTENSRNILLLYSRTATISRRVSRRPVPCMNKDEMMQAEIRNRESSYINLRPETE